MGKVFALLIACGVAGFFPPATLPGLSQVRMLEPDEWSTLTLCSGSGRAIPTNFWYRRQACDLLRFRCISAQVGELGGQGGCGPIRRML
jgi:hypothetical protein